MKIYTHRSRFTQLAIVAGAVVLLVSGARLMKAFNPQPDPPALFGMIGVTPADTMQINVVNVDIAGIPPGPCKVNMRFLDNAGNILKQQVVTVKPTQAASLDLTGIEAGGGFRTEVHPALIMSSSNGVGCSPVGSVEVFNSNSGETTLLAHPIYIPVQQASTDR
jgi:hypothetical protein